MLDPALSRKDGCNNIYLTSTVSVPLIALPIVHLLPPTLLYIPCKTSEIFLVVISFPSTNMNKSLLLGSYRMKSKFTVVKDKSVRSLKASRRTSYR